MKKVLAAFVMLALSVTAADAANLQLFFSTQAPTDPPGTTVPAEFTGATNLEVGDGVTPSTVYLWARTEKTGSSWDIWNGLSVGIDVAVTGTAYNPFSEAAELLRWNAGSDLDWADGTMFGISVDQLGLGATGDPMRVQGTDERFYPVAELTFAPGDYYAYLNVGTEGIARKGGAPGTDLVYFGFGDEGLLGTQFSTPSTGWDIHIVPEPASMLLLGLAGLLIRRR